MATLSGNTISTTYQSLLKTEDNAAIGTGRKQITDGSGNDAILFVDTSYNAVGAKGDGASVEAQNPQFTLGNTPMAGAGTTYGLAFSDIAGSYTYNINQNRFGGVQYDIYKPSQHHIFRNLGSAGTGEIVMDSFSSQNRSNNWYIGYQNSADSLTYNSGTGDLTLGRTDNTDLIVNIPTGGGGAGVTHRTDQFITPFQYDSGNGSNFTFFTNTTIFTAVWLSSGTLSGAAVWNHGLSATPNAVNLSLWTAGATASSLPCGGYGGPSTLVHDFGNVDTSTTSGLQEITGASVDIEEGLYYMAIGHQGSWDTSFKVYDANATDRSALHYVVDDSTALGITSTSIPIYYDAFSNPALASTTYASTPYSGSLSTTSARCAMFLKYAS